MTTPAKRSVLQMRLVVETPDYEFCVLPAA